MLLLPDAVVMVTTFPVSVAVLMVMLVGTVAVAVTPGPAKTAFIGPLLVAVSFANTPFVRPVTDRVVAKSGALGAMLK